MGTHLDTKKRRIKKIKKEKEKFLKGIPIKIHTGKHGRFLGGCLLALNEGRQYQANPGPSSKSFIIYLGTRVCFNDP